MKKLATISFALLLTSACSVGNFQQKIEVLDNIKPSEVRVATNSEFKMLQDKGSLKSDEQLYIANLGAKDGSQFLVKFDFNSFKTKASVDGTPAKLFSDVKAIKIFLTTSNTDPLANIVTGSEYTFTYSTGLTGSSKVYNFANVPVGTYYTGAIAYSDVAATTNIVEGGTTIPANFISVNSATVASPSMAFSFSDLATAFDVTIVLANAIGADLDSNVTVQDGVNNLSASTINVEETNDAI